MKSHFFFPAAVSEVASYASQLTQALGRGFTRARVHAAITEALLNGVLYGALRIEPCGGERDPDDFVARIREAELRAEPLRPGVSVDVLDAWDDPNDMLVRIRDPGAGFDWRAAWDAAMARGTSSSRGRGLLVMRKAAVSVAWNERGNEVTLRFRRSDAATPAAEPPPPVAERRDTLESAEQLMTQLMADPVVALSSAEISSLVIPSRRMGGDIVDALQLSPTTWAALVVDVAGHGVSAALTAATARALLRDRLAAGCSLDGAIRAVDAILRRDFDRTRQHAAIAAVLVDETRRTAEVVNAGCPPVLVLSRALEWTLLASSGPPAGIEGGTYETTTLPLRDVARIVMVSDGITEGFGAPKDTHGALAKICAPHRLECLASLPHETVRSAVDDLGEHRDDVAILWVQFC